MVPSTLTALQNLAMAVNTGIPVILSGYIGAGKTSLIEHLALLVNRQLIKVCVWWQVECQLAEKG